MDETRFQYQNKQRHYMNQINLNAITIAARHKDGDWVDAELAFRQTESGNTSGISHSQRMIQTQENYKELKLGLSPNWITTIPKTQEQRRSSQTHTRHVIASLGTPTMLNSQTAWI